MTQVKFKYILKLESMSPRNFKVSILKYDSGGKLITKKTKTSPDLVVTIIDLCSNSHINTNEISSIQVSRGPGSFTGLRISMAVARAIGVLTGVKINHKSALINQELIYNHDRFGKNV